MKKQIKIKYRLQITFFKILELEKQIIFKFKINNLIISQNKNRVKFCLNKIFKKLSFQQELYKSHVEKHKVIFKIK